MSWIQEMLKTEDDKSTATGQYITLGDRTEVFLDLRFPPEQREVAHSEGSRTYWDYHAIVEGQQAKILSATSYLHRVILKELSQITMQNPSTATLDIRRKKKENGHVEWIVFLKHHE